MLRVNLLILLCFVPFSLNNPLPTLPPDTANAYLRSFLPWWPNNTDFSLRAAPTPSESENSTEAVLLGAEYENGTDSTTGNQEDLDPATLRVQALPDSPLDALSPENAPKSFVSESMNHHDGNFIINFDEMGECPRDCSNDLREALGIVLQDMSHVERYHRICEKYSNASTCVNEDGRCDKDDRGMFEMMTSGLHYMCVEQELAFNATIKCIDDEAGLVQSECDAQCQTKNLFMNWMMRTAFQDTIQQGVNGIVGAATGTNANPLAFLQGAEGAAGGTPTGWADMLATVGQRPPSPQDAQQGFENFRQFTNDLCRIGDCMLDCIRSKFNTRCEGSAGTLLSEVFVRPIAASQNKLSILRPVLGSFMPEQCNYLTNNADLKKHRIDSTMDEELKRMYAEKMAKEIRDRNAQDELLSNLVPLDENGVPLPRALPELKSVDSPLDVSVKTLDQLILDMYSKNETKKAETTKKSYPNTTTVAPKNDDQAANTTAETTKATSANITHVETTTLGNPKTEEVLSDVSLEASGNNSTVADSGEGSAEGAGEGTEEDAEYSGSGNESTTEEEYSGSEEVSATDEGHPLAADESNEGLLTGSGEPAEEASGTGNSSVEGSGSGLDSLRSYIETSGEASGGAPGEASGETSGEASGEVSGEEEFSGYSGESPGENESSGEVPLTTTLHELY